MALDSYRPADRRRRRIALAAAVLPLCAGLLVVATPAPEAHAAACTSAVDCLSQMTLAEKAGQMTQVANTYITNSQDIATYGLGSVLSGGGRWSERRGRYRHAVGRHGRRLPEPALRSRLGIPLIYGVGRRARPQQRPGRHDLPAQHRHGRDPRPGAGPARSGRRRGRRSSAPASTGTSRRACASPATTAGAAPTRSFGEDPRSARRLATAAVTGLQGAALRRRPRSSPPPSTTWATAAPTGGIDQGDTQLSRGRPARRSTCPPLPGAIGAASAR